MTAVQEKKQRKIKWHEKWWGVFLLVIIAFLIVIIASFIYQYIFYVQLYVQNPPNLQTDENVNKSSVADLPLLLDVRGIAETEDDPSWGPKDAEIVLVEFSDFQCPYCKQVFPVLKELRRDYEKEIRFIYRDFLNTEIHPQSMDAALAGECADEQGMFWEYHDFLFMNQDNLAVENLKKIASNIGLDSEKFNQCLDTKKYQMEVLNDLEEGISLGITGTPTFFINGNKFQGAVDYQSFKDIIEKVKEILQEEKAL